MTPVLISFFICFSVGLLLSAMLIYRDVKPRRSNGMNENLEHIYFWQRVLAAFFSTCQAALSIVGIVAIGFALRPKGELYWVGMAVQCNLQILSGTNLARMLRVLTFPRWTISLAYMIAILTAPNFVYPTRGSNTGFIYNSESLHLLATAISGSTQQSLRYTRLLAVFIITNAIAALCQLCGAVIIYSITLANSKADTILRQGILLACTATQLLCLLTFYFGSIERRIIEPFRATTRGLRSTSTHVGNIEGAMRLDSLEHCGVGSIVEN